MGGAGRDGDRKTLEAVRSVVFKESETLDDGSFKRISGYDFNKGMDLMGLLGSMASTGFQASNLGDAIEVVNQMLDWKLSHEEPAEDCSEEERDPTFRESMRCKIFLGSTSNLISSGIREIIRFLVEHRMVDVLVTTAGGIEEDLIKCLAPTYRGDFSLRGAYLRSKGLNRIGNLLVSNDNYCKFEDWINPILNQMLEEQSTESVIWTPSKVIARLGKEINDESSYLYWAYKNGIAVFCPALTDGSLGDMLYCHSIRSPDLLIDIVQVDNTKGASVDPLFFVETFELSGHMRQSEIWAESYAVLSCSNSRNFAAPLAVNEANCSKSNSGSQRVATTGAVLSYSKTNRPLGMHHRHLCCIVQ